MMRIALLAFAFIPLASISAFAQATSQPAQNKEDEVVSLSPFVVTSENDKGYFQKNTMAGTRSSERLLNIPQNIQIINQELIQDLAQDNPIETLKYGSSGVVKRTSLLGDMFARGFRVRGFLMDNVGFGSNYNVPIYDVDRMEMVKGPAALLFGQASATGGLLNLVTKRPSEKRTNMVRSTVGSFNFRRVEANSTGPTAVGGLNYRATIAATDSKGARKGEYFEDRFFSVALDQQITPKALFSLDYKFYHKDNILAQILVDTNGNLIKVPENFSFFETWADGPNYSHFISGSLKTEVAEGLSTNLVVNFNTMDTDWNRLNANGLVNATTGMLNRTYQNVYLGEKVGNVLLDVVKSFSTGAVAHKISFGGIVSTRHNFGIVDSVFYSPININSPVYGLPFPTFSRSIRTPPNPAPSNVKTVDDQHSGYLQEQLSAFQDRLIVVGGLRYNNFKSTATNRLNRVVSTLDAKQMVKRWGVVYKPIRAASIYYNYSESFVFNTGTFVSGPRDGQPLEPSVGENKEIGLKVETAGGLLFGSIAVYDLTLTKVRVLFPVSDGTGGIGQFGSETNKGYEVDIGTSFETPLGSFQAIFTLYNGDQKNFAGVLPDGVTNDTWSVFASQAINAGPLKRFKVGFGMFYKGAVPQSNGAGQLKKYFSPAYTTSTANFAYEAKSYRIALNLDNVFDKDFVEGGENATWLYTNPGLTWKLSVEYRF